MSIRANLGSAGIASPRVPPSPDGFTGLCDGNPEDVDAGAAAPGTSTEASRCDHVHHAVTGVPVSVGSANAAGTADSLARSDHVHDGTTILTGSAPANVTKAAAAVGVATTAARADHKHDVTTAAPASIGSANSEGVATSLARSDHVHDGTTILTAAAPADVTKAAAAVGVATTAARADHKHNVTTAAPVSTGSANSEGTATTLARSDHVHDGTTLLTSSAPEGLTDTGTPAVGVATTAARADHQHGVANAAAGPPQNGVCYWLGPITFTAGGGGASDDIIYNANAPRKFRVVDMLVKVTTAVNTATIQLRDATGGAGNLCASAVSGAAAALVRNNNVGDRTIAAGGTLTIRRADNTTAGIMYVICMPEA